MTKEVHLAPKEIPFYKKKLYIIPMILGLIFILWIAYAVTREDVVEIKSIQVDGGAEFMGAFESACESLKIPLYVLPPRRPQYNGTVERSHSTVKCEFYYQYSGIEVLWKIRDKLQEFTHFYNTFRPHQNLNYMTPMQYCNQLFQIET